MTAEFHHDGTTWQSDQIRHYGPARYLCGLTDGTWTPDHTTIQDFTELMGEDGMRELNEYVLCQANDSGLVDTKIAVGDTTAQQAPMSYPTEVGLMSGFLRMVGRATKRAGGRLRKFGRAIGGQLKKGERFAGKYRFFSKTKAQRLDAGQKLLGVVRGIKRRLGKALKETERGKARLKEGSIGALKSGRYTFDRPNVRSTHMLTTCGQRSVLGYNLNRLVAQTTVAAGARLVG